MLYDYYQLLNEDLLPWHYLYKQNLWIGNCFVQLIKTTSSIENHIYQYSVFNEMKPLHSSLPCHSLDCIIVVSTNYKVQ